MTRTFLVLLLSPVLLAQENARQTVLESQRQWIAAYNRRDPGAVAAIEADDFRITFGDGNVQTKADQIAALQKPSPAGVNYEIAVESTEVRFYGNTAVLTGVVVERAGSNSERSRYTDTWVRQKGRWRVVSSHLSNLK